MDITSAISTATALGELTKLIIQGKIDSEVKAKASELYDSILNLQGTLFTLHSQNHELLEAKHQLERQQIELANWEKEAERYELSELCPGVLVYSLKKNHQNTEPFHHLCPNCYQESRKSILQRKDKTTEGTHYHCKKPTCNAVFIDHKNREMYVV